MDIAPAVISQYAAALSMLEECVVACPDDLWNTDDAPNRFYQMVYHALFYTHLYVQPKGEDFALWAKHIDGHQSFGGPTYPGGPIPPEGEPYTKDDILEYLAFCREQIASIVPTLDFEAEAGFPWLPFGKLELQFYSIRHIMLHVGELAERLSAMRGIEVGWVGAGTIELD